jgi:hypothetical protein
MRTLKALLCLSALAGGLATSVAQNVYSLNIVGYVNVPVPAGYSLLANPLKAGVTNGANEIMTPIDGSIYLTWNGVGFDYRSYDSGFGGWIDSNFLPANPPELPPGKGFFLLNPGAATTATFVGEVIPAPGVTNALAIPAGYSLLGSPLPASATGITAAPVRLPLIDGMVILTWNGVGYNYRSYDTGFGGWIDSNFLPASEPSYTVGQGFFLLNPGVATTWPQWLP